MTTPNQTECGSEESRPTVPGRLRAVVRQSILDLRSRLHGYQLHLRAVGGGDENGATGWRAMAQSAAFFALQKPSELKKLTGKMPAFVNCPLEALNEALEQVFPPTLTVLEVPAVHELSSELIASCQQLKALGYRIALDDFQWNPNLKPLLDLADYIKVEFGQTKPEERRELFGQLHGKPLAKIAKGVATQADYRQAREEGFELFQGYFFCEPVPVRNRRPPVNQLVRLEILKALQQDPLDLRKLSQLVKRDGPLTFQLLRLVNSPLWGMRQTVDSVDVALLAVGDDAIRRIATTAIASEFNGSQPAELLMMAMVRGRFCEQAGGNRNADAFGQYLLGLLSLLPAMQGQPMSDVAPSLPLSEEIRSALLGKKNQERVLLGWLESYERADWAGCDAAAHADSIDQQVLAKVYVDAVAWAEAALHTAG